mgnify:CR=1 FL=1
MELNNQSIDATSSISNETTLSIELGDIIEIISPTNYIIHESIVYVTYIDYQKMRVINVANLKEYQLNFNEDGTFTDESITQINIVSRSEHKGYARQNNLLPKSWVNIHISGEIPKIITGEIMNLEEDMIEILTYPELKTYFIDFMYAGLPENIPIEKIVKRDKPHSLKNIGSLSMLRDNLEEGEIIDVSDIEKTPEDEANILYTDSGESIINIPENNVLDKNIRETIKDIYTDADTIIFVEELGEIKHLVEKPESERSYAIDVQVNNMMDVLLSDIPESEKSLEVIENVNNLINKYKQLREHFSNFDDNQNIYSFKKHGPFYKPLVEHLNKLDIKLKWLIPVVSLKKKIYDQDRTNVSNDIVNDSSSQTLTNISDIQNEYYENNVNEQVKDYNLMQRRIQNIMLPFEEPENKTMYASDVLTDIEGIIDNLDEFNSTVVANKKISIKKYATQRFNTGLDKLEGTLSRSGKMVYDRRKLTPNDNIHVKSLLMLPSPVVKFSSIDLHSTNILKRSNLHHNYFMLFRTMKNNTDIIPHVLNDLSNELDYEKIQNDTKQNILDGIHEFILEGNEYTEENERFLQFLESIIPQTKIIFKLFHKHIANKLSVHSVVQELEPFMIYMNDLNYSHYNEIRKHIKTQIESLRSNIAEKGNLYDELANKKYDRYFVKSPNIILELLAENKELSTSFFQNYAIYDRNTTETDMTKHEILYQMLKTDNLDLYMNGITTILISLMTPDNLINILNEPIIDDMSEQEKIKSKDCSTRYLSKKYSSLEDLQKDNHNNTIHFDKDYDDTPYKILDNYKHEQSKLSPDEFVEYLVRILTDKHEYKKDKATELAKTIIAKKKLVEDGHYAILEIKPQLKGDVDESKLNDGEKKHVETVSDIRSKISFYRRLKNMWIEDTDINENTFIDTKTLFCNIGKECFSRNKICESKSASIINIKDETKEQMLKEFEKRFQLSVQEIEDELKNKIHYHLKIIRKTKMLHDITLYRANNLSYEMGKYANTKEVIQSPHEEDLQLILGQDDFVNKQSNICKFVDLYTREPMVKESDESPFWLYCKDTNVKLLPISVFKLANSYVSGDDFMKALDNICTEYGTISDDRNSIVDKYSGIELRKVDFTNDETYDDAGFRITSHDILEKDLGDTAISVKNKVKRLFESETTETIYNITKTICSNIDIPIDSVEDFTKSLSNDLISKYLLSENSYLRKMEKLKKKKGVLSYNDYRNETIIMIVASSLFVSIQIAIPNIHTNRNFPGCVRSFEGYPLSGVEDVSGITYIACVINNVKSSISPWNSIKKLNEEKIFTRMMTVIEKYILSNDNVENKLTTKREWLILNPNKLIPKEHNIKKWNTFLPPVVKFTIINSLHNISSDFKDDLKQTIKKGNPSQYDKINTIKSKLMLFGYSLIESINNIVKNEKLLLKTSAQLPYLENSCCHEDNLLIKPMIYFNEHDKNIEVILHKINNLSKIHKEIKDYNSAPLLFHPEKTGLIFSEVSEGRLEHNIYSAIFHYCNFDRKLPIPESLKFICDEKPEDYKSSSSIEAKIDVMKKNTHNYDVNSLDSVMNVIYNNNIVEVQYDIETNIISGLSEFIEHLDNTNSNCISEPLREHIRSVINQYNPSTMHDVPTKELDDLTNYLILSNENLYTEIMTFFDDYGNLDDNEFNKLHEFLSNISSWKVDAEYGQSVSNYDSGLNIVISYLSNIINVFTKVYPNLLINNADFFEKIPKHWKLVDTHKSDLTAIYNNYYNKLKSFRGDQILINLLKEIVNQLIDINIFVKNIPVQTDIQKEIIDENGEKKIITFYSIFGKQNLYLLFTHCYYLTIHKYITSTEDNDIILQDSFNIRQNIRRDNEELQNASNNMMPVSSNDMIEEININVGDMDDIKKRTCSLLLAMIDIESTNKKNIDYSYKEIIKKVNLAKEREKKGFTDDYLGKMSIENRKAENLMKKYRLGRWNVDQKKLIYYDGDTYERERNEILSQLNQDVQSNVHEIVTEMRKEVFDINEDTLMQNAFEEADIEANNIQHLDEDYLDGVVYEEDRDTEFE